jgi:hypothetical protein
VQLAARKVAAENERLRELLRLAGFDDDEMDLWARREGCGAKTDDGTPASGTDPGCARRRVIELKARVCAAASAAGCKEGLAGQGKKKTCSSRKSKREMGTAGNTPPPVSTASPSSDTHEPAADLSASRASPGSIAETATWPTPATSEAHSASGVAQPETACASPGGTERPRISPCKLLSLLTENPTADLAQVAVQPASADDPPQGTAAAHAEGDVECGRAYEMLMRYATSEEKMDHVARALEAGCTPTGQGGCAVRKKVVWEVLDGMCG